MGSIQVISGEYFRLFAPEQNAYSIEDIAHALSNICRFTGHTKRFYSVAQHSVLSSHYEPHDSPFEKLMHDAAEGYLGDISTPLKRELPYYKQVEGAVEDVIARRFGLDPDYAHRPSVKKADIAMLLTEKRDLLPRHHSDHVEWGRYLSLGIDPCRKKIRCWPQLRAKHEFLFRFYTLCPESEIVKMPRWVYRFKHWLLSRICS